MNPTRLPAILLLLTACGSSSSSNTVSSLTVTPSPCGLTRGNSIQLSAEATLPDGTKRDVSTASTWTTDNSQTATVNRAGVVVGVAVGVTGIRTEFEGASSKLDCTVGP